MSSIIGWSLSFRTLVVGLAAGLVVLGGLQLLDAPVDVLPEFSAHLRRDPDRGARAVRGGGRAVRHGAHGGEMLNGVAWVETIRSESVPGLSSIVLIFEPGTDIIARGRWSRSA